MKPHTTQFHTLRKARKAALSKQDKEHMRENVRAYMQNHPVQIKSPVFGLREHERGMIVSSIMVLNRVFVGVLVVMVVGGGVSLAAESAMPGDTLYPVKVGVNERVRDLAAVSHESEARLHAVLAERRLDEAARLALRGDLDTRSQAEIERRFERHVNNTEQSLKNMKKEDFEIAIRLSSDLEAALAAKEDAFLRITEGRSGAGNTMAGLVEKVRDERKVVASVRIEREGRMSALADESFTASTTAQELSKQARKQLADESDRIAQDKDEIESGMQQKIDGRFQEAKDLIAEADEKFEDGEFQEAIRMYRDARQKITEARAVANTSVSLRLRAHFTDRDEAPTTTASISAASTTDEIMEGIGTTSEAVLEELDILGGTSSTTTVPQDENGTTTENSEEKDNNNEDPLNTASTTATSTPKEPKEPATTTTRQ